MRARVARGAAARLIEAGQQALQAQQLVQLQLIAQQQHLRMAHIRTSLRPSCRSVAPSMCQGTANRHSRHLACPPCSHTAAGQGEYAIRRSNETAMRACCCSTSACPTVALSCGWFAAMDVRLGSRGAPAGHPGHRPGARARGPRTRTGFWIPPPSEPRGWGPALLIQGRLARANAVLSMSQLLLSQQSVDWSGGKDTGCRAQA